MTPFVPYPLSPSVFTFIFLPTLYFLLFIWFHTPLGLSDPLNLANLAAVVHPSHGIAILHIHRNDQWEDVYYRRIREHFKTIWLLRYDIDMIRHMRLYIRYVVLYICYDSSIQSWLCSNYWSHSYLLAKPVYTYYYYHDTYIRSVTSAVVVAAHVDKNAWMPGLDGSKGDEIDRDVMIDGEISLQQSSPPPSSPSSPQWMRWHSWHDPCANLEATARLLEYHGRWYHHHAMITMGDRLVVDCLQQKEGRKEIWDKTITHIVVGDQLCRKWLTRN